MIGALEGRGVRWLICGRNEAPLLETASLYERVFVEPADITQVADRARLFTSAKNHFGGIDVIINNAGVQYYPKFDQRADISNLEAEIDINLKAPIALCAEAIPHLCNGRAPMIINIASTLALAPKASAPVYCATKAGLASFSRALRYQLEGLRIRVVTVYPPLVSTAMTKGRDKGGMTPEVFAKKVIAAIDKGKDEVLIGQAGLLSVMLRIAPGFAYGRVKGVVG